MRARLTKEFDGKKYVLAARVSNTEMWLNPHKVQSHRDFLNPWN